MCLQATAALTRLRYSQIAFSMNLQSAAGQLGGVTGAGLAHVSGDL